MTPSDPQITSLPCIENDDFHAYYGEDQVCYVTFRKPSVSAVTHYGDFLRQVIPHTVEQGIMLSLLDMTNGLPSLRHLASTFRQIQRENPDNHTPTRTVVLHNGGTLLTLADIATRLTVRQGRDAMRMFYVNDREQAMAWLFENPEHGQ